MIKYMKRIILVVGIMLIFFSIDVHATSEGDIISFDGITTKMPAVSIANENDEEDPEYLKSISNENDFFIQKGDVKLDPEVGSSNAPDEHISELISRFSTNTAVVGIDISAHQGDINWQEVANSGVKFAMIRCGFRGYGDAGNLRKDAYFDQNIQGALNYGIHVGVYFYSTALNEQEALQEAELTYECIKNYKLTYPVSYDFEEFGMHRTTNLSNEQMHRNAKLFMNYIKSKGYNVSLYSSASPLKDTWKMNEMSEYDVWVAHYYVSKPNYNGTYQMWQYTNNAVVPGISTRVDVDVDYMYWSKVSNEVQVSTHVQDIGWMNYVGDGQIAGTTGKSKRVEAFKMNLNSSNFSGSIQYKSYLQWKGWEDNWKSNNQISGTTGQGRRIEALKIRLTGDISNYYDIYYRVHIQDLGWLDWAKNGEIAGNELGLKLEALQVRLLPKGYMIERNQLEIFKRISDIKYRTHVQDIGWMNYVYNGELSGTTGKSKRIEALSIELINNKVGGGIEYKSYIQSLGWENKFQRNSVVTGTTGQGMRLERIQMKLYGAIESKYDLYYRVHVANYGWLGWAKNGEIAGTEIGKQIEAIEIQLVLKNDSAPGNTEGRYVKLCDVNYRTHVENIGWMSYVKNGELSGTTGKSKRVEAINIKLDNNLFAGGIEYKTRIQALGWEKDFKRDEELAGTTGQGIRIEAIQIQLYGEISQKCDVYYRVHVANYGWLDWAKNGELAGTDFGNQIEAIEIQVVLKSEKFLEKNGISYIASN